MRLGSVILASSLLAACGHGLPGKPGVPSGVPDKPGVPGGASGEVDPNTCGNYAAQDAGAKLKAFLQATKDLADDHDRDRQDRQAELHHDGQRARHARGRPRGR